jgi:hypothetical protein
MAGHSPGEVVLIQDEIRMRVQPFFFDGFVGFMRAEVGGIFDEFFESTPLETNNITVEFDFTHVGFAVEQVSFEFQDFGGASNFAVNGHTLYELSSLSQVPESVAPGVTASISGSVLTLDGSVHSFRVGGQEVALDNVFAVPEPGTVTFLALAGSALAMLRKYRGRAHVGVDMIRKTLEPRH